MNPKIHQILALLIVAAALSACSSNKLAKESPPLIDMEAPLNLQDEPEDEELRLALAKGAFSGIYVKESSESLDDLFEDDLDDLDEEDEAEGNGVMIEQIVENSPGARAKLRVGDIIIEATPMGEETVSLSWPSEWRQLELNGRANQSVALLIDRAGQDFETVVELEARVAAQERDAADNFREEKKVGLIVRTATEVESRLAGLGPGAGAVVIGLSKASPWRAAGLRFQDVIVEVEGQPVAHPLVLLEAIKTKNEGESLSLVAMRGAERLEFETILTQRVQEFERFSIPLLFNHESAGEVSDTSLLFGLMGYEETAAAWEVTLLWFIKFGGGDSDELEEVDS